MGLLEERQGNNARGHDSLGGVHVIAHHVKFEMGGLAENLDGVTGIGNAGQLHLNAVVGLLADIRLGDAELVNTVADGTQGLIHGQGFEALDFLIREMGDIPELACVTLHGLSQGKLGEPLCREFRERGLVIGTGQDEFQRGTAHHMGPQHHDLAIHGLAAQILTGQGQGIGHGLVHIDAEGEVNAAAQIQAEIHFAVGQDLLQGGPGHVRQGVGQRQDQSQENDYITPSQSRHDNSRKEKNDAFPAEARESAVRKVGPLLLGRSLESLSILVRHAADGRAAHLQLGSAAFEEDGLIGDLNDSAEETGGSHHVVAFLQLGKHLLVQLRALLLRTDEQKPEDDKHENERKKLQKHIGSAGSGTGSPLGTGHGKSFSDKRQEAPPKKYP